MSWIKIWKKSKYHYGWRHVNRACRYILNRYDHPLPCKVVALARGGLVPATIIANQLGVRQVYSLGVSSYEQYTTGEEKPGELDMYQRIPTNIKKCNKDDYVLIVDDISDRGGTFKYAEQYITNVVGGQVITMSLVIRPDTKYTPTYYCDIINKDRWVIFPWEQWS